MGEEESRLGDDVERSADDPILERPPPAESEIVGPEASLEILPQREP